MCKKITFTVFIIGILMGFVEQTTWGQESQILQEQDEHHLVVDQALDKVEENFKQTIEEVPRVEIGTPENLPPESDTDISEEVEILEGVNLTNNGEAEEVLETKIIPLLHAEASGIIEALNHMKSSEGEITFNEEDRTLILKDMSEQLETMSAYVKEVDILLETEVFKLDFIEAQDVIGKVTEVLTKNVGEAQINGQENSIIVTDTPLKIGSIKEIIKKLDRVNKEILIETKILHIVLNDEHAMGVDWEAIVSEHQSYKFPGFTLKGDFQKDGQLNLGVVSQEDYAILLEALDTVGVVHEIFDDLMRTKSEEARTISILSSLLRDHQSEGSSSQRDEKIISTDHSIEIFQGERVEYRLSPMINRDGVLTAVIRPELIGGNTGLSSKALEANVEIQVEDGSTIVIGSLFEEVMVESAWKVPLLGDLPLLGFVFRNQGEELRIAEIITFLTIKTVEKE